MKAFSLKKRDVPKTRKKYGIPETKKDILIRQKHEREEREIKSKMTKSIKDKSKDEFHFEYYSVNKNMVKKQLIKIDELKKTLKYIDSEIIRVEKKVRIGMRKTNVNKKIIFADGNEIVHNNDVIVPKEEFELYIDELKIKRAEVADLLALRILENEKK